MRLILAVALLGAGLALTASAAMASDGFDASDRQQMEQQVQDRAADLGTKTTQPIASTVMQAPTQIQLAPTVSNSAIAHPLQIDRNLAGNDGSK